MNGPTGHPPHAMEEEPAALDPVEQADEVDEQDRGLELLGDVVALHADGLLEVERDGVRRLVDRAELEDRALAQLTQTGRDPMHVEHLAELLAVVDHRGLRAQVGPQQALEIYRQAVTDYRNVSTTAHTIVQFLMKAQPRARMALQEEAGFVLGLEGALLQGGALHADRCWLQGLEALLHFLQASLPREFADSATGVSPVIPATGCYCPTCAAARATDSKTIARVFSDPDRVQMEANTGGLMIVPFALARYLRHAANCPQALVDEQVPCSCGLSTLLFAQ